MSRGHARLTPSGRWELKVYVGRDPLTGAKDYRYRTVDADGQRDADDKLAVFVAEVIGDGKRPGAGRRTFGELAEKWFEARSGDGSPNTAYTERGIIDTRLAGLAELDVLDVTTERLDEFYAALRERGAQRGGPLSASSVVRTHGVVRRILEQGVRWRFGGLRENAADKASPGRVRKHRITPPTKADVVALLAAADERDPELLTFFFLDAETGARRGELAALRLNDFGADTVRIERDVVIGLDTPENRRDFDGHAWPSAWQRGKRRTLLIEKDPKTEDSIRTVTLAPATLELVRDQARRLVARATDAGAAYPTHGFLFPADVAGERPLRPDTWTHRFADLRESVGLERVRLHDLRHFVATTLLTSGVDLATVAGRLGHGGGGKTTLAVYGHFLKEPDRGASELMADILGDARKPAGDVIPLRRRQ